MNLQEVLWKFLEETPEFQHPKKSLTLDEIRRRCYRQVKAYSTITVRLDFKIHKINFFLHKNIQILNKVQNISNHKCLLLGRKIH